MGTKALWFGADSVSAPSEVAGWVTNVGYGNYWSQRLISPLFAPAAHPAGVVLAFDASVDFQASGGLLDGDRGNEFLGVQGLKSDGTWAFLVARYMPVGSGTFNDTTVAGRGVFHAEVHLD